MVSLEHLRSSEQPTWVKAVGILIAFVLTGLLIAEMVKGPEVPVPSYYLRPSEYESAVEKCKPFNGMQGLGVVTYLEHGETIVMFTAACATQTITWKK